MEIRSKRVAAAQAQSSAEQDLQDSQVIRGREVRDGERAEMREEDVALQASENESAGEAY